MEESNEQADKSPEGTRSGDADSGAPDTPGDAAGSSPHVIGIGASAGGLQALQDFFEVLPPDTEMSFVVIMHLSPEHESGVADVLQRKTSMPVLEVTGTVSIEPNHIYVIPPDKRLVDMGDELSITDFEEPRGKRTPINYFFRSLAAAHGERSGALVFSGGGTDGSVGIKAVKEAGGLVMVQDPEEAQYDPMPRSAIATGLVDVVLPVRALAERLVELKEHQVQLPRDPERLAHEQVEALQQILAHLRAHTGHDFSAYKRSTVLRRIQRRMQVNNRERLSEYLTFFREHAEEGQALFRELLIGVTNFFRDSEAYAALKENVIPELFNDKEAGDTVRVWVVGCSTGEEAYSVAILLLEHAATQDIRPKIQIFASDLDEKALAAAREGQYPLSIESDVSQARLKRFFVKEGDRYRVSQELRDTVLFATHSVLKDPPFSKLDLITCRNLLIYLQRDLQKQVFDVFHYALRVGRYLFLGSSETADGVSSLFRVMDKEHRLYQARKRTGEVPHLPRLPQTISGPRPTTVQQPIEGGREVSEAMLHRHTLEAYAPPSLLVDGAHNVVHLSERAGRYLQHPAGTLTSDVTRLVRAELQMALRSALFQAFEHGEPTVAQPVAVQFNGHLRTVYLTVRPVERRDGEERLALVIFNEGDNTEMATSPEGEATQKDPEVRRLDNELQRTRERLQTTVEEFESSQEELKAQNEELQSVNEEYKSTMEELETSKEELQSVNEELQTVNNELQNKLEEISRAHSDLQNLMAATDVATLFLDRALQIERHTPQVEKLFNVKASDSGRPISDLTHRLEYDALESDASQVLDTLVPIEQEVRGQEGRWYLMRMRPYRTVEDKIDGVVLTFIDITKRREAEQALRESEERFRLLMKNVEEYAIMILDTEGRIATWNTGAERLFGYTEQDVMGRPGAIIFTEEDQKQGRMQQGMETAIREGEVNNERWYVRRDGSRFWGAGIMTALYHLSGELRGFAKVLRDNTERKETEERLERRVRERTQQVRDLTSTLTMAEQQERHRLAQVLHDDLQQRLYAIQMNMQSLKEECDAGNQRAVMEHVQEINEWMKEAIQTTRQLSVDLSPPVLKDEGLLEALNWLRSQMQEMYGLNLTIEGDKSPHIPEEGMEVLLFQIVRELLFNVVKHADTDAATVKLEETDHHLILSVSDEGQGFEVQTVENEPGQAGLGLFSVRERVDLFEGEVNIESEPGAGTRVTIRVPLDLSTASEE